MENTNAQYDQLDVVHEGAGFEEEDHIDAEDVAERMQSDAMPSGWVDTHRIRAPWDPLPLSVSEARMRQRRAAQRRTLDARRMTRRRAVARGPRHSRGQRRHHAGRATPRAAAARGPDPDPSSPSSLSRETLANIHALACAALAAPSPGSRLKATTVVKLRRDRSGGRGAT
jgi:hypothetical protein